MKRKLLTVLGILAVVLMVTPAFASTTYTFATGNFTPPPAAPYGTVTVSLIADANPNVVGNQAGAQLVLQSAVAPAGFTGVVAPTNEFTFFGEGSFDFNTASTGAVTVVSLNGASVNLTPGTSPFVSLGSGNVDGFGNFTDSIKWFDGPSSGFTSMTVDLVGTFGSDATVLTANAQGAHIGGHIFFTGQVGS